MKPLLKIGFVFCLCFGLALALRAGIRRLLPSVYSAVWESREAGSARVAAAAAVVPASGGKVAPVVQVEKEKAVQIYATGYITRNGRVMVSFSDGSSRSEVDGLQMVTRAGVKMGGEWFYFRPHLADSGAALASPVAVVPSVSPVGPPDAPSRPEGDWRQDWDGVHRLVVPDHLAN
ncbi:MAG: hypothetical protein WA817_12160 [Candidatus Acidiferrum sp.]